MLGPSFNRTSFNECVERGVDRLQVVIETAPGASCLDQCRINAGGQRLLCVKYA